MSHSSKSPETVAHADIMRSALGRARGLGPSRSGTAHWWGIKLTSLALIPLTLWFIMSIFHLAGSPRAEVLHWAAHPVNGTLLVAMILMTFHHMQAGLQTVIEDYVHAEPAKTSALLLNKAVAALLGLASVIAALKLAFTG